MNPGRVLVVAALGMATLGRCAGGVTIVAGAWALLPVNVLGSRARKCCMG